jgi:hypothetical protein
VFQFDSSSIARYILLLDPSITTAPFGDHITSQIMAGLMDSAFEESLDAARGSEAPSAGLNLAPKPNAGSTSASMPDKVPNTENPDDDESEFNRGNYDHEDEDEDEDSGEESGDSADTLKPSKTTTPTGEADDENSENDLTPTNSHDVPANGLANPAAKKGSNIADEDEDEDPSPDSDENDADNEDEGEEANDEESRYSG